MPSRSADAAEPAAGYGRAALRRVRQLRRHAATDTGASGWVPGSPDVPRAGGADGAPARSADAADSVEPAVGSAADAARAADAVEPVVESAAESAVDVADARRADWATRLVGSGPWGTLAEKWVPEPLRGARIEPGRRGAVLLSVVAALAAIVAAVGVWWSKPQPAPVSAVVGAGLTAIMDPVPATGTNAPGAGNPPHGEPTAPSSAGSTTRSTPSGPVLVSVTGRVRRPGLVTVPADARVADAIAAAGGVLDTADLSGLNLAAHVSDGASVVVAGPGGSSVHVEVTPASGDIAGDGAATPGVVNINSADVQGLQQLPGVGPVTAAAIIEYRTQHGRFTDVAQLQEVAGIGPVTFARIAPHATL